MYLRFAFTPNVRVYTFTLTDETAEDACDAYEIGSALKQVPEDRSKYYSNPTEMRDGARTRNKR